MNVLIIEDNPIHLKLANAVLEAEGIQVTCVDVAEKAAKAIHENKPEVIIVDLSLPKMDGLTLIRNIRRNPESRNIPVIALTGYPNKWTQQEATDAGCNDYIVKPIHTQTLIKKVFEAASKKI